MKHFCILLALVFLVSCGAATVTENEVNTSEAPQSIVAEEAAVDDIESELENISEGEHDDGHDDDHSHDDESEESKVMLLDAPYTNPAGAVDMQIEYSLDADWNIEEIEVSATTYDLTQFNEGIQKVIGMNLEDASKVVTGSSLTDASFQAALKGAQ
jgi:hypothetical protein